MNITDLTEDVLLVMIEFMSVNDRLHLKSASMKMNTETRNKLGYLRLNAAFTREYVNNPDFREHVHTRIANPKLQVALFFKHPLPWLIRIQSIITIVGGVHALDLHKTHFREDGLHKIIQCQVIDSRSFSIYLKKCKQSIVNGYDKKIYVDRYGDFSVYNLFYI